MDRMPWQIQFRFCFDKFRVCRRNVKWLDKPARYRCRFRYNAYKCSNSIMHPRCWGKCEGCEVETRGSSVGVVHSIVAQWTAVLWFLHFRFINMHTTYICVARFSRSDRSISPLQFSGQLRRDRRNGLYSMDRLRSNRIGSKPVNSVHAA